MTKNKFVRATAGVLFRVATMALGIFLAFHFFGKR